MYIEKRVSFDAERDSDIIKFLDSMTSHKANSLIRHLLREHIRNRDNAQFERIERKVDDVLAFLKKLEMKQVTYSGNNLNTNIEDNEIAVLLAENLDKIGV